jgi:hypothetical protein
MTFDRSTFLSVAAGLCRREEFPCPALGGSVWIRTVSAGERDRFEERHLALKHRDYRARILVLCSCDEAGQPLFTDADVAALSALPAQVLDPIVEAASKLNGVGGEAREEARGNSDGGQDSGSPAA